MEIEVNGGTISVPATGQMTPRQAGELAKKLKDAVKQIRRAYCLNGHPLTEANGHWKIVNGYSLRKCRLCRLEWEHDYYMTHLKELRAKARERARRRYRQETSYACTPCD